MILAAAVCPHPPMIIPEIAAGAASELVTVRESSEAAVAALLAAAPERIVVIGPGGLASDRDESAGGSFAAYGVDLHAGGGTTELPLSLTVGGWLLDRAGWTGRRTYSTGTPDLDGRVALLVMADGSAKRSTSAPGFLDERAEAYDARVAAALAAGDPETLASLDLALGDELWAAGIPALRTLGQMALGQTAKGTDIVARLRIDVAPFGVGYWVADWVLS